MQNWDYMGLMFVFTGFSDIIGKIRSLIQKGFSLNIWFLLWVFLTIFILGFFGWSFFILLRQKKAWAEFAQKNKLSLIKTKLFASNAATGTMAGFPFYLYSEEQTVGQTGTRRYRTIVQFELKAPMPAQGIVSSAESATFAKSLSLKEAYEPTFGFWNKDIIVLTDNKEALASYMTEERCKSFVALMTIKSIACILIFDPQNTYLRFETPDAFDDAKKLDRFVSKAAEHAKILSI